MVIFRMGYRRTGYWMVLAVAGLIAACGTTNPIAPSEGHLYTESVDQSTTTTDGSASEPVDIPEPVTTAPYLPEPTPQIPQETYTVVVNQVPVRELLFALARDARLNIDIVGDIEGRITLNAIDQTLLKILDRIALQAAIRYEVGDDYLIISADQPYLQSYAINYLNMSRRSVSRVDLATQVGSISLGVDGGGGAGTNNSQTQVENTSENRFWDSLVGNIQNILGIESNNNQAEIDNKVIVNRETGVISVRGTRRQHAEVQAFVDQIMSSARRQVLIEATVVEITLSDRYQAGVDWRVLTNDPDGFSISQSFTGGPAASANVAAPNFLVSYADPTAGIGNVLATLKLLDQFGDVQILSSPKIIALNNQSAVLKVVDNRVYFTVSVERERTTNGVAGVDSFETTVHTVPVGFVMNLTPFISEEDEIILNVRPTISRILGFVNDPNPALANASTPVVNRIPEIQVREMESLLRVDSGQVAIIGGLMQDRIDKSSSGVPGLSNLPLVGKAFSYEDNQIVKTELLVFLRPTVINNASLDGDLKAFKKYLPNQQQLIEQNRPSTEVN